MSLAGHLLLAFGALVLLIAALGLHTLPDALSRQHAATKAGSLGIVGVVAGVALIGGDAGWIARALAIIAIVWLTMPVASHVLARAAYRTQQATEPALKDGSLQTRAVDS
ncbi:MAG: monovalent cation/H(+) antiporter subunit G [Propionivibrio sp.]|nr:monovalent cation/H(+) antiporter subunit G [Propionivibrio sp.]